MHLVNRCFCHRILVLALHRFPSPSIDTIHDAALQVAALASFVVCNWAVGNGAVCNWAIGNGALCDCALALCPQDIAPMGEAVNNWADCACFLLRGT